MNMFRVIIVILVATALVALYATNRQQNVEYIPCKPDPIPQYMFSNFSQIIIQGFQAATSTNNEERVDHLKQALGSIANIVQLAFRHMSVRLDDHEAEMIHDISSKLYQACIHDEAFLREFEKNIDDLQVTLAAISDQIPQTSAV